MENNICDKVWQGIFVYFEYHHGEIHPVSYQLLGKAYDMSDSGSIPIYGVVIGRDVWKAKEQLKCCPVKEIYLYESEEYMKSDLYSHILIDCICRLRPSIVLIGGTKEGRTLAPLAAVEFRAGLTADCTELLREEDSLIQIRPAFGGDIMAKIITPSARPQFATVRFGIMEPVQKAEIYRPQFIECGKYEDVKSKIEILGTHLVEASKGIEDETILVVGGRGVKDKKDMDMLFLLASMLGGQAAGTRGLVEKGFITSDRQIGLSGKTVRPKLLIAFGVSGSVQFITGMKKTPCIVAVNNDERANIFSLAHYPVLGDLYEIIPCFIDILKQRNS